MKSEAFEAFWRTFLGNEDVQNHRKEFEEILLTWYLGNIASEAQKSML